MLIKEGHCKINDQDKQGATPSHKGLELCIATVTLCSTCMFSCLIAAGNGQTECLQWLLDHGADGMYLSFS